VKKKHLEILEAIKGIKNLENHND